MQREGCAEDIHMARLIIRTSIDGETSGETQQEIRQVLEGPLARIGTAVYEGGGTTPDLLAVLQHLVQVLSQAEGSHARGSLDHLWVYLDQPDD